MRIVNRDLLVGIAKSMLGSESLSSLLLVVLQSETSGMNHLRIWLQILIKEV
jgi:hypothetical protein